MSFATFIAFMATMTHTTKTAGRREFDFAVSNKPRTWKARTVHVRWDRWDNKRNPSIELSPSQLHEVVSTAFLTWAQQVGTVDLKFEFDGPLAKKVDSCTEFNKDLNTVTDGVILLFDDSGSGLIPKCRRVKDRSRGLTWEDEGKRTIDDYFTRMITVIDTQDLEGQLRQLRNALAHEAGHAIGVDHSLIGLLPLYQDRPIMSPYPSLRLNLHPDDEASMSDIYPSPVFGDAYGWIEGRVVDGRPDHLPQANVSVIAIEIDSVQTVIGSYSESRYGYVTRTDLPGSDIAVKGTFRIPVRGDRQYRIRVDPVPQQSIVSFHSDTIDPVRPLFDGFDYDSGKAFTVRRGQSARLPDIEIQVRH